MSRDVMTAFFCLAGVALGALALLDWLGYSAFVALAGVSP